MTTAKIANDVDPLRDERTGKVREVGSQAVWSLSSCKPGFGVEQLRDDTMETYWQSDGQLPHLVNIQFRRKTTVQDICIYTDYKLDESYTPSRELPLPLLMLIFLSAPTTTLSKGDFSQYLIRPTTEQSIPAVGGNDTVRPFDHCETSLKPPEHNSIETYQIDLDLPPEERWKELVVGKKLQITNLLNYVKNFTTHWVGKGFMKGVDFLFPHLANTLPVSYRKEMQGISEALNMEIGDVALYNLFYEFFSVCTSIVIQAENGTIYHGRNLDFGLLLGWDSEKNTWSATELLRPLVVQLDFVRKGEIVYRSISYAGYTGILTAVKKGQFALSINERFRVNGGVVGIAEWIVGFRKQSWLGVITRQVMENCESYSCAQKWLSQPTLIAPVYFILSGNKASEGCIITRGRSSSKITPLGSLQKHQNASWYIVQTNYDQWEKCPSYDDRNTPSMFCMEKLGRDDVIHTLTNVLSTRPVLNKLTTYTALMSAELDMLKVWIQTCPDPCWPW